MTTRVKVCCIASPEEATLAIAAGVHALGLVSRMPSGPGVIPLAAIAAIARTVPPGVRTFLLTSQTTAGAIAAEHAAARTTTIQICDRTKPGTLAALRRRLPGIELVQVIHVTGPESVAEAVTAAREADALLLDSGHPTAATKELGGTGRTHDWTLSRRIRESVGVPLYLAGGLTPGNVAEAIRAVEPFGVDVCTGLRTGGALDEGKLGTFVSAVRGA